MNHFILIEKSRKKGRIGGATINVKMYRVMAIGVIVPCGEFTANTSAYKGETSEAFTALQSNGSIDDEIMTVLRGREENLNYYYYGYADTYGLKIELL